MNALFVENAALPDLPYALLYGGLHVNAFVHYGDYGSGLHFQRQLKGRVFNRAVQPYARFEPVFLRVHLIDSIDSAAKLEEIVLLPFFDSQLVLDL